MWVSVQLQAQTFLLLEKSNDTHLTGGWVGFRRALDILEKRNIFPCRDSNLEQLRPNLL
jgi:hypothetical protein